MATSQSDVSSNIISALKASDPDLDTSVGTTTRKIIDAVAESLAEAYSEQYVLSYTYDVDSKVGGDLDDFCQTFGIARLPAKKATGSATFSRVTTTEAVTIPVATTIRTSAGTSFVTLSAALMEIGTSSVSVPIQASVGGTSGNVAPSTVTVWPSGILNVLVTNPSSVTGGTDAETDSELRLRWKRTVFRSLAGTEQMYLGVALDDPNCTAANVLTAQNRRTEQVQVVSGAATSTVVGASFVFSSGVFVTTDTGVTLVPGLDYTWSTSLPPVLTLTAAGLIKAPNGTILNLEFDYTSNGSRNDPANGLMHRVDLWCAGKRSQEATQSVVFRNTITFNTTGGSPYNRASWLRLDGTQPTSGNIFIPLAFGPILSVPSTITTGGQTYGLVGSGAGTIVDAYRIVHEDSAFGYSGRSMFGLEWDSTKLPANNSTFSLTYAYNEVPTSVQTEIDRWRLAGVDVLVHEAKTLLFKFSVAIIYATGVTRAVVDDDIDAAVSKWLSSLSFSSTLQASDALAVIHAVSGVDSVRFLNGSDYPGYVSGTPNVYSVGIQRVVNGATVASSVDGSGRAVDYLLSDREAASLASVYKVAKAQNSFGTA